jgi:hypothetical protein
MPLSTTVTPLPPPSVDDPDMKLGQECCIVRAHDGHALAYVYFEKEPGRRAAAKLLTRDEARRIAANIATAGAIAARLFWLSNPKLSPLL